MSHVIPPTPRKLLTETLYYGMVLPWTIYDRDKRMLLRRGMRIDNRTELALLLKNAIYRDYTPQELSETTLQAGKSPFHAKQRFEQTLGPLLHRLAHGQAQGTEDCVRELVASLQTLCERDPDGLLAAIHLTFSKNYVVLHPLHSAILCELLGSRLEWEVSRRGALLAAALTMDIGMLDLQNQLFEQVEAPSPEQREAIAHHPESSVKTLLAAGVRDELWLTTVYQHHERVDGSGYPEGVRADQIREEAKVLALADMYAAMVTPRRHRPPILAHEALRSIFLARGKAVDEALAGHFIREIGIFPPGVFVHLANGETAIVTRRSIVNPNRDSTAPIVHSVLSPCGETYEWPRRRDCHEARYHIERMCMPDIDVQALIHTLWSY